MDKKDLSDLGDQILGSVEDAIRSKDFKQLNKTISDTVNDALSEAREHVTKHMDFGAFSTSRSYHSHTTEETETYARTTVNQDRQSFHTGYRGFLNRSSRNESDGNGIRLNETGRVPGILLTIFGSIGLFLMLIFLLVVWIIAIVVRPMAVLTGGLTLIFGGTGLAFGFMLYNGIASGKRFKRARLYVRQAGKRFYCTIEELASAIGKSREFVKKDIQKMMKSRIFPQAYLDEQKTCLMLNEETYRQYLESQEALKKRNLEEKENQSENVTEEFTQMMTAGKNFLKQLKEANDSIPGEVISRKIADLEDVIRRIFDSVSRHPEQGRDMERFMNYYLPTTVKLVHAYRDFDIAGAKGENVTSAKEEIEETLDTIHKAFERLLDDLYEDAVLDATTDASVLQTMLKKDGFGERDFTGGKPNE